MLLLFCRGSFGRSRSFGRSGPAVQVVSDAVAVAAFRELGHHCCRVRRAVAGLACRDHLVLILVAVYAGQGFVFSRAGGQQVNGFLVAAAAFLVGNFLAVDNVFRLVSLVALLAIAGGLLGVVGLVALGTSRDLAVNVVAGRAVEFAVLARELLELLNLRRVAGQARIGDVAGKNDIERGVGVLVAPEASLELIVLFAGVALAAFGDIVLRCGAVAGMTVEAGDLLVSGTGAGNVCRRLDVTFYAVVLKQFRGVRGSFGRASRTQAERNCQGQASDGKEPDAFYSIHRSSSVLFAHDMM